jgi:putative tryptophan/tyrosine transport system substrate-binding protein
MRRLAATLQKALSGCFGAGFAFAIVLGAVAETKPKVALLGPAEEPRFSDIRSGLVEGLRDHGHVVGGSLELIEAKVERGDHGAARAAAKELVREGVAVVFVIGSEIARVARQVAPELPIVFITPGDPVAAGLVASLSRPGGNITGMTFEFPELSAKRLELLKEISPQLQRVLVLHDSRDASSRQHLAAARDAAGKLGLMLIEHEIASRDAAAGALSSSANAQAVLPIPGGAASADHADIVRAANARRLPIVVHTSTARTSEALASYGTNDAMIARQAARLLDKILRRESAGDLPVERPTSVELVINLKTAKALGVAIPPALLARADEVIE